MTSRNLRKVALSQSTAGREKAKVLHEKLSSVIEKRHYIPVYGTSKSDNDDENDQLKRRRAIIKRLESRSYHEVNDDTMSTDVEELRTSCSSEEFQGHETGYSVCM